MMNYNAPNNASSQKHVPVYNSNDAYGFLFCLVFSRERS